MRPREPLVLVLLLAACSGGPAPQRPCDADGSCLGGQTTTTWEIHPPRLTDLLVVMDDSASMAARQEAIIARLAPEFAKTPGGLPELRIRVISSSVPAPGLEGFPGCAPAVEARACTPPATGHLQATRLCGSTSNFAGSFEAAFSCFAHTGGGGCGWEQPLAAARAALEGDPQDGSRFLRKNALLAIVFITDEDDCSVKPGASIFGPPPGSADDPGLAYRCHEAAVRCAGRRLSELAAGDLADCTEAPDGPLVPVEEYARFFVGLKARPHYVAVSVAAGSSTFYGLSDGAGARLVRPACQGEAGPVLPAVRLAAFARVLEALQSDGAFVDLCNADDQVERVLRAVTERLAIRFPHPCLPEGLVDTDPDRAGVQPMCVVTESHYDDSGQRSSERPIAPCANGATAPCWAVAADPQCPSGLRHEVDRGACLVPAALEIKWRCATGDR